MAEVYLNKDLFDQDVRGFLFYTEPTPEGTEKSKLVFEWDPNALVKLREGDIVAVESFSTLTEGKAEKCILYTLLEITRTNPTHLTIDRLKRFRFVGAVREFLKETTKDFEAEDPRLIKDHIYIEAEAVNTDYMMKVSSDRGTLIQFDNHQSKPILGRDVGVLVPGVLEQLVNRNIVDGLPIGNMYSDYDKKKEISVKIRADKLITHHYTIFAFTGAGKSNLNSSIVSRLINKQNLNVLIFDISDEYTALLSDVLHEKGVLLIDFEDAPESLVSFYKSTEKKKDEVYEKVASDLAIKMKKPGVFDRKEFEVPFKYVFLKLLREDRIKLLNLASVGVKKLGFKTLWREMKDACGKNAYGKEQFEKLDTVLKKNLKNDTTIVKNAFGDFPISLENLEKFEMLLNLCYQELEWNKWKKPGMAQTTVKGKIDNLRMTIEMIESELKGISNVIDDDWIIDNFVLNQKEDIKLGILVSSNKEQMGYFIATFIDQALKARRKIGTKPPHNVLFSIDEAHEFISQPPDGDEVKLCSKSVERLTRMGRKFGLGVCLASQRVAYLNTTALSNCHTTFIGALPRSYDRKAMNEAYGVSYEVLNRVVTFPPGHWYVVSSGALGINNVPIRITSPNREVELVKFLQKENYLDEKATDVLKKEGML